MARRWKLLQLGTRIRIKDQDDIEGKITQHFTEHREIIGYIVELEQGVYTIVLLDDEIEALGV